MTPPRRSSTRIKNIIVSSKRKRPSSTRISRQQQKSTAVTPSTQPTSSIRRRHAVSTTPSIRNPYAKKKKKKKAPPPPPMIFESEDDDSFPTEDVYSDDDDDKNDDDDDNNDDVDDNGGLPVVNGYIPSLTANKVNGTIDFTVSEQIQEEFSVARVLQSMKDNPVVCIGETDVSSINFNSSAHEKVKERMEKWFFTVLSSHKDAKPLADVIDDPTFHGRKLHRFYILCRFH